MVCRGTVTLAVGPLLSSCLAGVRRFKSRPRSVSFSGRRRTASDSETRAHSVRIPAPDATVTVTQPAPVSRGTQAQAAKHCRCCLGCSVAGSGG